MESPLRERSIGERLADMLRQAILDGSLAAGEKLRQEALAKQYGVSRIPVREALQTLERDGFVVVKPNRHVIVAEVTDGDLNDHYEVRALIEGALAKRAANGWGNPEELREAYLLGEKLLDSVDLPAIVHANEMFHRAIWDAAGSTRLYSIANHLWTGIPPYRALMFPSDVGASIREHSQVLEAILARDGDAAQVMMSNHILRARDEVLTERAARTGVHKRENSGETSSKPDTITSF